MRHTTIPAERLIALALYSLVNEGASLDADGAEPVSGYMVARQGGLVFDSTPDVSVEKIAARIKEHVDSMRFNPYADYFGIWRDNETGKVYFDISENVAMSEDAIRLAKVRGQKAIWDVSQNKEIRV